MTTERGELFPRTMREARRLRLDPAEAYEELGWRAFQRAAWSWLWEHRELRVIQVGLLGVRLFSFKAKSLRPLWTRLFGACPFEWSSGP